LWIPTTNGTTCGAGDHSWSGGGLVDYCVASDALAIDARRLKEAGFDVDGPDEGGKRLPDADVWPLWFVAFAFLHNCRFGALFILGLAAEAILRLLGLG
jgi:hypothetical protein